MLITDEHFPLKSFFALSQPDVKKYAPERKEDGERRIYVNNRVSV